MSDHPPVIPGPGPGGPHAGHHVQPHEHQWLKGEFKDKLKGCAGRFFCLDCEKHFDGVRCQIARDPSESRWA